MPEIFNESFLKITGILNEIAGKTGLFSCEKTAETNINISTTRKHRIRCGIYNRFGCKFTA